MSSWPEGTTKKFPKHARAYTRSHALPNEALRAAKISYDATADALCIPFPGTDAGVRRYLDETHEPRFMAPEGWEPRLYFAPLRKGTWASVFRDPTVSIYWPEGPLKALAFSWHSSKPTIAANGLDGWGSARNPNPDFDKLVWSGRPVVILVDSDAAEKNGAQKSLRRLASYLETLGARVSLKIIPSHMERRRT